MHDYTAQIVWGVIGISIGLLLGLWILNWRE